MPNGKTAAAEFYAERRERQVQAKEERKAEQRRLGDEADSRPVVTINGHGDNFDLAAYARTTWKHLAVRNAPASRLFLSGRSPARIETREEPGRESSVIEVVVLGEDRLIYECANLIRWNRQIKDRLVPSQPPRSVAKAMLATPANLIPLPTLTRIVNAPVFSATGILQTEPGYDRSTGTYLRWAGDPIALVSTNPTPDEVRAAVRTIMEPIDEFPFVEAEDRAHAVALMLLPFVRDCIKGATPGHLFIKSRSGEGASLLATACLTPALGRHGVAKTPAPTREEEWEKKLTSQLRNGQAAIFFDNVIALNSPSLQAALTSDVWEGRRLGKTEMLNLPNRAAWVLTGINPDARTETLRRCIKIRLRSGLECPWLPRPFTIPNLEEWLDEHRSQLIHGCLTIIRAWFAAGCPKGQRRMASYESWSEVLGGILAVGNVSGFLDSLGKQEDMDLEREAYRWLVRQWERRHSDKLVTAADLAAWALDDHTPLTEWILEDRKRAFAAQERPNLIGYTLRKLKGSTFTFAKPKGGSISFSVEKGSRHEELGNRWFLAAEEDKIRVSYATFDPALFVEDESEYEGGRASAWKEAERAAQAGD